MAQYCPLDAQRYSRLLDSHLEIGLRFGCIKNVRLIKVHQRANVRSQNRTYIGSMPKISRLVREFYSKGLHLSLGSCDDGVRVKDRKNHVRRVEHYKAPSMGDTSPVHRATDTVLKRSDRVFHRGRFTTLYNTHSLLHKRINRFILCFVNLCYFIHYSNHDCSLTFST